MWKNFSKMYIRNHLSCLQLFGQFYSPLGDLLLAFLHPPPSLSVLFYMREIPVKLFCSPYCCWLLGLTVLNFRVQCWDGHFCLSALRVRGLLRLKWLGSNHKNRASAFLHAPACPTVGEGREDEAR